MPLNDLIPIVNQLQEAFAPLGIPPIDLPQIAVVGSQSSGKSSVLESLVGYDFLPRGVGIVTRRPLILQLVHEPSLEQDYAQFAHINRRIFSFDEVKMMIQLETDKVAGTNKGVSSDPLILKVHSANVVNLTLVDLPGLTKVPVGDQPSDISEQIRGMVLEVISRPNCIVLAVTAANQDVANSDGLQIAREVDPKGCRTIGVLTKLDLMDSGTDARDVLEGRVYPLQHGYVGVVNRSQRDIDTAKSMKASLQAETEFFSKSPSYSHIASKQGSRFLSTRLNAILEDHIRSCMPDISNRVKTMLRDATTELQQYGDDDAQTQQQQRAVVLNCITRFCQNFFEFMQGRSRLKDQAVLYGPARIRHIFNVEFRRSVCDMNSRLALSDEDIHTVRRNAVGVQADLFVPNSAFETLVKQLILQLEDPSAMCVRTVSDELKMLLRDVLDTTKELSRFSELRDRVWRECMSYLTEQNRVTGEFVQNLINMEVAYINTDNPEFDKIRSGVYRLMAAQQNFAAQRDAAVAASAGLPVGDGGGGAGGGGGGGGAAGGAGGVGAGRRVENGDGGPKEGPANMLVRDSWKPHYLKLHTRQLDVFVSRGDAAPNRTIQLEGCSIRANDAEGGQSGVVELVLPKKSWLGQAETITFGWSDSGTAAGWLSAMQRHQQASAGSDDSGSKPPAVANGLSGGGDRGVYAGAGGGAERWGRQDSLGFGSDALRRSSMMPPAKVTKLTERERMDADVLRQLLEHYFRIVRATVLDSVPKAIMLMMVNLIQDNLQERLMQRIYLTEDDEAFSGLTRESEEVRRRRTEVREQVACLRKAISVMREL